MIVYRICQTYPPDHNPLDGRGSFLYGARWNSPGYHAVYTASSLALARAELARHVDLSCIPDGFLVYEIEVPDEPYPEIDPLPTGWDGDPPTLISQQLGNDQLRQHQHTGFKVPSICDPGQYNLILNPMSPAFTQVKIRKTYPFVA